MLLCACVCLELRLFIVLLLHVVIEICTYLVQFACWKYAKLLRCVCVCWLLSLTLNYIFYSNDHSFSYLVPPICASSRREVMILNKLKGSKHIIYLKDVFEDSRNLFLVTELCTGGELYDQIVDRSQTEEGRFSEVREGCL